MGKKEEKKKKSKVIASSPKSYSLIYQNYFNNKKYSDITIKIGEETIFAHKMILISNSEFFEKLEDNSFEFPKEDFPTAKNLIKFYYTGIFEYTEESSVLLFAILANKYKTKNFSGKSYFVNKSLNYQQKYY
jgi:hypothetical protein